MKKGLLKNADYEVWIRTKRVHLPDDTFLSVYQILNGSEEKTRITKRHSTPLALVNYGGSEYRGSTVREAMKNYFSAVESIVTEQKIIDSVLEREELEEKQRRRVIAAIISRKAKEQQVKRTVRV